MRILFAGTPATALPSLRRLVADGHDVAGVVTRPPARVGRRRTLRASAVHEEAEALGIPVATPASLKDRQSFEQIAAWQPEAVAVVAYGLLVPAELLAVPRLGWINLHFSLLPAWRGAAPVQHAIAAGDSVTGACTFRLEEGLDAGPVFARLTETIGENDTSGQLLERLADSGAGLLSETFRGLAEGTAHAQPQSGEPSYAPAITTAQARIDWTAPAPSIDRLSRAYTPAPGPWTMLGATRVKLGPLRARGDVTNLAPGQIEAGLVGTGEGAVALSWVAPAGKKPMTAVDWLRGARLRPGQRFDDQDFAGQGAAGQGTDDQRAAGQETAGQGFDGKE